MKKIIFIGILLSGAFSSNAQQSYGEQFFVSTGVFGFSLGSIDGQNGWEAKTLSGEVINGCTVSNDVPESLTGGWGISNNSALSIAIDSNFTPSETGTTFGCYSPLLYNESEPPSESVDIALMILIDADDNNATTGSLYKIALFEEEDITSKVGYFPDGNIKVVDIVNGVAEYVNTGFTWTDHEWAQLSIRYNFINGTIKYVINGQVIH